MALVAENIHDKLQYSLRALADAEAQRESSAQQHLVEAERQKIKALEEFVRMPYADYLKTFDRLREFSTQGAPGQDRNGRGQPAPGHFHRQEIHQPRPVVPRLDPGRQHGLDEGRRKIRIPPRLQIFHLRHLVDPPGHHPQHRRPGAHHPHPGAHDRNHQQADAHAKTAAPGFRPRTDAGGNRRRNANPRRTRPRRLENGAATHLAAIAGRRQRGRQLRRFHRGQGAPKSRST